ncbi:hypothetical protein AGMMS50229_19310 [Campylobacterota bacterium]|nr:hypothetical protein AGMMS50229_19310 [Campylobacterota bacterium]
MRFAILFFSLCALVFAASPTDKVLALYQKQDYQNACLEGAKIVREYRQDELFVNAYGIACLNSDFNTAA